MLACIGLLGSASLAACGKDEGLGHPTTPGSGGASAGAEAVPVGGESAGGSGFNGGVSGSVALGGNGMTAGTSATAGAAAVSDAGSGGAAGAAGNAPDTPGGEQLVLCARLTGRVGHADAQARAFAKATFADCRINWVVPLGPNLDDYRQQLVIWNLQFWGCQGQPVGDFGLVYGTPPLSAGDASLLIELYLTAATAELDLSPSELDDMRGALERLAKPWIVSDSSEPSASVCSTDAGGAGGAAAAGAGGAP